MIYQKQLNGHDPANGVWGDCFRTAIACVLDLPPEEVPHFYDNDQTPEGGELLVREWFSARGLALITLVFDGKQDDDAELAAVLNAVGAQNPDTTFLISGRSKRGCNHTVVGRNAEIIWDPSPSETGLEGPCDDGFYWVQFIGYKL